MISFRFSTISHRRSFSPFSRVAMVAYTTLHASEFLKIYHVRVGQQSNSCLERSCCCLSFRRPLLFYAFLVNNLVPCAWLFSGALDVWRLYDTNWLRPRLILSLDAFKLFQAKVILDNFMHGGFFEMLISRAMLLAFDTSIVLCLLDSKQVLGPVRVFRLRIQFSV